MNQFPFDNKDFDRNFAKMQKRSSSIFKFAFGAWFVWLFAAIAFWGVIAFVVWHFIAKFW